MNQAENKKVMGLDFLFEKIYGSFEGIILYTLVLSLMVVIGFATYVYIESIWLAIDASFKNQNTDADILLELLSRRLYDIFGAFLMILLGLELVHTVKVHFQSNIIKIKSIIVIALIATARHVIQIDYHKADTLLIFSIAMLLLVLMIGFYLTYRIKNQNRE